MQTDVAKAFCEEKGAKFFDQIVEHKLVDGLVDALELKEVEKGQVLKKIKSGGDSPASPAAFETFVKAEFAKINRGLSGVAGQREARLSRRLARTQRSSQPTRLAPNVIDAVKACDRAHRPSGRLGFEALIELGSGTIVDGGAGSPTNRLSAAHLFIEPNPNRHDFLDPLWVRRKMPVDIDWTSTAPLILAIGMWEGDDKPSKWMYWAELVTPLATLQELHETPDGAMTEGLDLAVLRIRGRLELNPPEYTRGELWIKL